MLTKEQALKGTGPMRLYITQKDFDEGVQANCSLCPVGRSANREAKKRGYLRASVGSDSISFEISATGHCLLSDGSILTDYSRHFPYKVRAFIRDFDQGNIRKFKPFSFEIQDIPNLIAGNPG